MTEAYLGMDEAPSVLRDGAARRHAIHATGSVLVQAPAGSGKTTLLTQRYLRLLAAVDAPERILALTFTRRAAQEMRERVMHALQTAHLAECPVDANPQTWSLSVAAMRHLETLNLDVQRHPSRLRIETIDAFNAWLAGQLPITAGAGARLNLVDNAEDLYQEAARRTLAHEEADSFGTAVDRVLALDDQRWRSLVTLIAEMLPSRDRWLPLLAGRLQVASALDEGQLLRVRRHLDEDLELLVLRTLRRACEALGEERLEALSRLMHGAARRLGGLRGDLSQWQTLGTALWAAADDVPRWRGMAALLLTNENAYRKRLTKHEGFAPQCADKAHMMDLLAQLDREPATLRALIEIRALPAPAYDDQQWARVREVAQVLVLAAAQLEQVFRERGAVDFPAVSMAALRALGTAAAPSDLSLRLDYRLQHILVDEFQDTSSAQLELVKLLTAGWQRGDGRSVFCVGDPMQSIYGFRQAEVRAFLELAEDGIGEVQFDLQRLSSNFRSAKSLVDWSNACFSRIMPRSDDRDRGAIAFRPGDSAVREPAGDHTGVNLRGFATRREEARAIAEVIAARTAQHPEWRIVVLVRARAHAREIAASLRARGVAFRAVDIEPLQDRAVVRDLVTLICALLHLGDRTAWLAVLRAPWVGLRLADLLRLARCAPVIWDAVSLHSTHCELSEDGRARCERLRLILDAAFPLRPQGTLSRWVERTWLALGGAGCASGPQDLEHAQRVFERLRELEERGLPDAAVLATCFADLYADHGAAAAVEIMTIHKAKGLEFDMVVLPALDRHIPLNRDPLMLSHQFARAGRDGMVMAARPGVAVEADRLFEYLRHQSRDAAGLEAQRLLYVACTRAKWQLHLTATIGRHAQSDQAPGEAIDQAPWTPHVGSLLAVLWPIVAAEFQVSEASAAGRQGAPSAPRGGPLLRVPRDWSPGTHAAVPAASILAGPTAPRTATPVFDWAGETARRVGSLVHAELQVMNLDRSDESSINAREAHFCRWLALHGVPADRLRDAGARVTAALIAVLQDSRGRWILQRRLRDDLREHELSGLLNGEVVRVVFDRSFIDDQGVRWVIDYKTSQHSGADLGEFLDREVERYRGQLKRYAQFAQRLGPEPVRVALYFPLLRAWREWTP